MLFNVEGEEVRILASDYKTHKGIFVSADIVVDTDDTSVYAVKLDCGEYTVLAHNERNHEWFWPHGKVSVFVWKEIK